MGTPFGAPCFGQTELHFYLFNPSIFAPSNLVSKPSRNCCSLVQHFRNSAVLYGSHSFMKEPLQGQQPMSQTLESCRPTTTTETASLAANARVPKTQQQTSEAQQYADALKSYSKALENLKPFSGEDAWPRALATAVSLERTMYVTLPHLITSAVSVCVCACGSACFKTRALGCSCRSRCFNLDCG